MADGLNRFTGIGTLGADADLRFTPNGTAVANFRIAINETYVDKDKNKKENTEWVSCVLWGARGEALAKYLTKGSKVCVEGGLRTSSYEKDGQKHYKTEINVSNVVLLGSPRGQAQGDGDASHAPAGNRPAPVRPAGAPAGRAAPSPDEFGAGGGDDSDLPF